MSSSGAKRPEAPSSPFKAKRRKQATPIRIADVLDHSDPRPSPPDFQCKVEPKDEPPPPPRPDAWTQDFQAKMADLYKNAANFNPLCGPFSLFPHPHPPPLPLHQQPQQPQQPQQRGLLEPIRIFNPEAYCELCSKEFCNKYFLKTHKANKHGIYENNGGAPPPPPPDHAKSNIILAEYAKSYEAALLQASQRHKAKLQRIIDEADLQPQPTRLQDDPPKDELVAPRDEHDDSVYTTPTPRKLSPDSSRRARDSGFNTDTLRRLGVINPEAFCKICCKEYCNKYFLKTHKIKRHGLLPSPKEPTNHHAQDERRDGQTSPLNLIMAEEGPEKIQVSPDLMLTANQVLMMRPPSAHTPDSAGDDIKRETSSSEDKTSDHHNNQPPTVFISEDLQKLQTMISQLNDLSVNKIVECCVCKKEFDNNYILQFHMMSEHGVAGTPDSFAFAPPLSSEEPCNPEQPSTPLQQQQQPQLQQQRANCTVCDKDFPSLPLLKKHIDECHKQQIGEEKERRASMSLTPTNSYCEICNKELCNKYFMKTHMQRMHGIEIENGTQIGGVICDICNKELCSKYFLRVHKHNTHGIVEPGTPLPQMRGLAGEPENSFPQNPISLKTTAEPSILSSRFVAHFVEVCPFCSRRFRTSKWLKAHLLADHGKAGVDKWKELEGHYKKTPQHHHTKPKQAAEMNNSTNQQVNNPNPGDAHFKILNMFNVNSPDAKTYNCSYCPFTTSILSFLYVHEKSHSHSDDVLCPVCPESFAKPEALQMHILTAHPLPVEDTNPSNGKSELYECYECDFKSHNFAEMEAHLKQQHCAVKDMPPIYAVPVEGDADRSSSAITMQPFVLEENAPEIGGGKFVPSLVFLPVRRRATGAITISFNLTPA